MKGLELRCATVQDASAVSICVRAAYEPYVARLGQKPGPLLDDYADLLEAHRAWVVVTKSKVVGLLILIEKEDHILLDNVAVHPDYQGKGIGQGLMALAEREAQALGYSEIQLYTHEKMLKNQALYEKLGYRAFDKRIERGIKRIYMRKRL